MLLLADDWRLIVTQGCAMIGAGVVGVGVAWVATTWWDRRRKR